MLPCRNVACVSAGFTEVTPSAVPLVQGFDTAAYLYASAHAADPHDHMMRACMLQTLKMQLCCIGNVQSPMGYTMIGPRRVTGAQYSIVVNC